MAKKDTLKIAGGFIILCATAVLVVAPLTLASVSTDKDDYSQGETVTISGDGYWAGETVLIEVTAPYGSESRVAVANGSGEFSWSFVLPNDESAFGEYSYTATGQDSGIAFSGTFTDNKNFTITFAGTGGGSIGFSGVFLTPAPSTNPCTSTCTNALNNNATGTLTVTPNADSIFAGWSGTWDTSGGGSTTCSGTTSPCTFSLGNKAQTLTATFNSNVGTLQIVKQTVGGDDTFGFTLSGTTTSPTITTVGGSGTTTITKILAGSGYSVTETTVPADWDLTSSSCTNGSAASTTISAGATTTCTFINTKRGVLSVKKVLVNDNGGTVATTSFSFLINGASTTPFEADGQNDVSIAPGTYTVTEAPASGYATSTSGCTNVSVTAGATTTCTIVNDDIPASLTLIKVVINDNGGTGTTTDWTLTASGPTGFGGFGPIVTNAGISAGTYDLSESGPSGYTASNWVCTGGNQTDGDTVEIGLGENVICTITNDDIAAQPPPSPLPLPCGCKLHSETIVSDGTNMIGGAFAIPVATSSAWTASIPGATWIWQASSTVPNAVVAFEKSFTVVGTVLSAQLDIASDNSYKVFIDNVQVAADASATNFTLATQDVHDLTANVTPGVHTLRIEVTNNGVFGALNPAGLLYKFEIRTCPPPPPAGIQILICNAGIIINSTLSRSSTGGNTAGESRGGSGSTGGDVTASGKSGDYNNGGASGGSGGAGGNASRGGLVRSGSAASNATTTNDENTTIIRVVR